MSGFIKRERTVNPAGGLNPASIPNVGQYGWTKYDSAVVNQLIQYVEMAKSSSEAASEAAKYVQDQLILVDNYTAFIMDGIEDFEQKYVDFLAKYDAVVYLHSEVENLEKIVTIYHEDITKLADQAYKDAQAAERWYEKTYLLYLEFKGELVTKGNWDPETTDFPPVPTENSVWNVVVASGKTDVSRGDFVWNAGDTLMYTLTEAKFNQVKNTFLNATLMKTITDLQSEISEIKETINGYVFE